VGPVDGRVVIVTGGGRGLGCAHGIERVVGELGHLDAVVNNVGILRDRMITSMSEEEFDAVTNVHPKGSWNLVHHACVHFREQAKNGTPRAGRIVNTTSGAGLFGNIGQTNHGPAKAAIANRPVNAEALDLGLRKAFRALPGGIPSGSIRS